MKSGYTQPAGQLPGFQTFVENPSPDTSPGVNENHSVLPSPPNTRSKPFGKPEFNGPPASADALDGKPLSTERARTLGKPGEDSPPANEPATNTPVRRPGLSAATTGPQYPGSHREHEQGGKAEKYYEKYYKKNRGRILNRAKRWNRTNSGTIGFKKDKQRRDEHPERFKRTQMKYRDPADRTQDWRDKNKKASILPIAFPVFYTKTGQNGFLTNVDPNTITIDFGDGPPTVLSLDSLFSHVIFENESDIDIVYGDLDSIFDQESETKVAALYMADFLYEKRPPDMEPGQHFDRGSPMAVRPKPEERKPAIDLDTGTVWDNPGSAKVIPDGHGFENNTDRTFKEAVHKIAARISDIETMTGPKVHGRLGKMSVTLKRVDHANNMWLFAVKGTTGTYKVRVKTLPDGNITDVDKLHVMASCSCPFWRWAGPEHWAKKNEYLYGKPVGTAAFPVERDPKEKHWACKHLLAVINKVRTFKNVNWKTNKQSSLCHDIIAAVAIRYTMGRY